MQVKICKDYVYWKRQLESYCQIWNHSLHWQEVYIRGGRNFGFLNLGPLGCLPGLRIIQQPPNGSCLEEAASTLAMLHNEALSELLSNLETQLKGFRYALYDFNTNLRQRMNHPSKYGTILLYFLVMVFKTSQEQISNSHTSEFVLSCLTPLQLLIMSKK